MRRVIVLLSTLVAVILGLAILGSDQETRGDNHSLHQSNQKPTPKVDGALNPSAIPDFAAYEVVFSLLSSESSNDPQGIRKRAYTALSGFSDAEGAALSKSAYEYKTRIKALDAKVLQIKDATWPKPTQQVIDQLAELQKEKEGIIDSVVENLETRLDRLDNYRPIKLITHINESVKRKIKGFSTYLPVKRTSSIGQRMFDFFSASAAQAGGCDANVYVYSSTNVDMTNAVVYGYGSYSEGYNNCGHIYTPSTVLYGPGGTYSSDGVLYLEVAPDTLIDGFFSSSTTVAGYCSIADETYPAGENSSNTTVVPYIRVYPFGSFSPLEIRAGGAFCVQVCDSTITLKVTASSGANGSYDVTPSYIQTLGAAPITISSGVFGGNNRSASSGQTVTLSIGYHGTSITSDPTKVKAEAVVSSSTLGVINSNPISSSKLTVHF